MARCTSSYSAATCQQARECKWSLCLTSACGAQVVSLNARLCTLHSVSTYSCPTSQEPLSLDSKLSQTWASGASAPVLRTSRTRTAPGFRE